MQLHWGLTLVLSGAVGMAGCTTEDDLVEDPGPDILVPNLPDETGPDDIGDVSSFDPDVAYPDLPELAPEVIVDNQAPVLMVADDGYVYWVNDTANSAASVLLSVPSHGGTPRQLMVAEHITGLADAGDFLYWADVDGGLVASTSKSSGLSMALSTNTAAPFAVAAYEGRAFWTDIDAGTVMAGVGGEEVVIARNAAPYTVTVVDDRVFWVDAPTRTLYSMHFEGNGPLKLASEIDISSRIVADGNHVYWLSVASDSIYRMPVEGGEIEIFARGQVDPASITLDTAAVYWTTGDGNVRRMAKVGGTEQTLADEQATPTDVAVVGNGVYWVNRGEGTIVRIFQ